MDAPQTTIWLSVFALLLIGLSVAVGKIWPSLLFYSRKFLHVSAISLLAYQVEVIDNKFNVTLGLCLLAIEFLLVFLVMKGFFEIEGRKSWGIIYFLPPVVFLLLFFRDYHSQIATSIAVLAFSDGTSAIVGRIFQRILSKYGSKSIFLKRISVFNNIKWGHDQKTVVGFVVFIFTTVFILCLRNVVDQFFIVFYIAFFIATVELLSGKGSDNFFIPLVTFFLMLFFQNRESQVVEFVDKYGLFLYLCIPLILIVLRLKWLSVSGVVFAVHLAALVLLSGLSLLPLLVFFILGTLAGKLNKKVVSDNKHNKPRDAFQVLANGGMVLIVLFLASFKQFNMDANLWMLVSIAIASADTLSSEIGMRFGSKTFNILTLNPIEKGLSGGVSVAGFIGAFLGAVFVACFDIDHFYFILFWGISGSVVDSLLGILFQAKYSFNGRLTDQELGSLVKGYSFVTNDAVNFLSNFIVVLLAYCMC